MSGFRTGRKGANEALAAIELAVRDRAILGRGEWEREAAKWVVADEEYLKSDECSEAARSVIDYARRQKNTINLLREALSLVAPHHENDGRWISEHVDVSKAAELWQALREKGWINEPQQQGG